MNFCSDLTSVIFRMSVVRISLVGLMMLGMGLRAENVTVNLSEREFLTEIPMVYFSSRLPQQPDACNSICAPYFGQLEADP